MTKAQLRRAVALWRRQKVRIIAITGPRKAGKDVLTDYILRNYRGVRHLRIADAPMLIAKILGLEADRRIYHALFGVNKLLYPIIGESAYKRRVAHILDAKKPKLAIVEAIRTKEEYEEFVKKRKGILIGIVAEPQIRYERAVFDSKRSRDKRDEGKMTFKEFVGHPKKETGEHSPIEREIQWILKRAHFIIKNDYKTKGPVYRAAAEVLSQLGLKRKSSR